LALGTYSIFDIIYVWHLALLAFGTWRIGHLALLAFGNLGILRMPL